MIYIAAVQYDRHGTTLLLRELALLPVTNPTNLYWYLLKPTVQFSELTLKDQRTARYLQRFGHHLPWECGAEQIQLPGNARILICNGVEVRQLLQTVFPNATVINAHTSTLSNIPTLSHIRCPFEHSKTFCATLNAYRLYSLLFQ